MNHNKIIIDRLYYYLRKKDMTINRLADLTGIRQSTLSSMINRESVPKIDFLYKICEALDITLVEFLSIEPYTKYDKNKEPKITDLLTNKQNEKLSDFIESLKEEI